LAAAFHETGYLVIGSDRNAVSNASLHAFIQADLIDIAKNEDGADRFFAALDRRLGGRSLAVLVNNAALQVVGGLEDLTVDDWEATLRVNVLAPFVLSKRLLGKLTGGCIINISSIHARLTKKKFVAYATSKAALTGLTRALAVDIGDRVRVNAIEPAALDTTMLRQGLAQPQDGVTLLAGYHPTGSIGAPAEVARLAVMIAEAELPFLNGAVIGLDGGISARLHDPG
jgi:NAD(P)-dependent dehydrogenase (short-subunit alcohol dehydrogenase family)